MDYKTAFLIKNTLKHILAGICCSLVLVECLVLGVRDCLNINLVQVWGVRLTHILEFEGFTAS